MSVQRLFPADRVVLREVGLRDGLQLVSRWPTTQQKRDWMTREFHAGVRHFEVGSFLPPDRFPQFADVRDMIYAATGLEGAFSAALTLNERGVADALETDVDEIVFVVSATETHSLANTRRTRDDALKMVARIDAQRRAHHRPPPVLTVGISMAFGCSLEGSVSEAEVIRVAESAVRAGADVIAIGDTVGFGGPSQVRSMARDLAKVIGDTPVSMHFHDTRGLAIANCAAALDSGIRILDASLAGLGGCPFAPGATGNTVFEDMVFLCETMGFETGIDIDALLQAREAMAAGLPGEPLYGAMARAGLPRILKTA